MTISNADIVPGDVIVLTTGTCFCDMVVVKADHIVVDESALTGEATPILKIEIDPTMSKTVYDPKTHRSLTISAGTEILEVGGHENDLGLVMTTGSFTSKGKLLTEVLSYQRHKFKFDDEVKFILVLLVIEAFILFGLVCYFLKDQFVYAWMYGTCRDPCSSVNYTENPCDLTDFFSTSQRHLCCRNGDPSLAPHSVCGVRWNFSQSASE